MSVYVSMAAWTSGRRAGRFLMYSAEARLQLGRRYPGQHFALKMGRVLAGLDFIDDVQGELGRRAGAVFFDPFPLSQFAPEAGGERVPLLLFDGFGLVLLDLLAGQVPALAFDFEAGGVLLAAAQLDDGLAEAAQDAELLARLSSNSRPWAARMAP
jgi:hypothetical protein